MNDGLLAHRTLLRLSPLAPQRMRDAHVLWSGLEYVAGLSHYITNKHNLSRVQLLLRATTASSTARLTSRARDLHRALSAC